MEGSAVKPTMVVSSDCIKAECHNPGAASGCCQEVLVISLLSVCYFYAKTQPQTVEKVAIPPAWYRASSELAHDQTADNGWSPQRGRFAIPEPSPPDNTNGSAPNSRQRGHHYWTEGNEQARKYLFRRHQSPLRCASSAKSTIIMAFLHNANTWHDPHQAIRLKRALG